ncbi:hypothetical protein FOZ60_000063 [Perkinsus olseni]|uniref:Uncharacterized protein n=1 Tax=Perkinsus olseni TaxID=32597 RepID=A0A7J6PNV8_PEROL|nr:hypothetical protein FOZ60_000063 [Perkinsus olseni]
MISSPTVVPELPAVRDPLARNSDLAFILIVLAVGMLFIVPVLRFTPEGATEGPVAAPRKYKHSREQHSSGPVMAAVVGVMRDIATGFDPSGSYSRVSSEPDSDGFELQEPMSRSPSPTRSLRISEQLAATRRKIPPVEMIDLLSGD